MRPRARRRPMTAFPGAPALDAFSAWWDREHPRLLERAAREVPTSPADNPDRVAEKAIAEACGRYELAYVPAKLHHAPDERLNEILALLVLKIARAYGRPFATPEETRAVTLRLLRQTADEDRVRKALGAAGAFLAPLLSPAMAKRAWRLFLRVPLWLKLAVAGGALAVVLAAPMAKPLSLGLLAREEFRSRSA